MSVFQSIFLGILQGIAEFLPISSSGHLAVAQRLFALEDVPLLFDIFLHLATLGAVVLFFHKTIIRLFCVLGRWLTRKSREEDKSDLSMIVALFLGTFITGVIGIFFSDIVPTIPEKIICGGFIVTALILILSDFVDSKNQKKREALGTQNDEKVVATDGAVAGAQTVKPWQGLLIGFAQGLGVLPGISRSGSTIAGALLCGVDRKVAGEFSFLLSIPAILGAFILELKDFGSMSSSIGIGAVIAGCVAAFLSGFFALSVLMKIIKKGHLQWFALYLIPVGILGIIFF